MVVTGVPTKAYRLPTEWIQPNTTVVNVASFKNVDEDKLLQIPGVVYVPMVGKVTVAMLERNLMRLYDNFHNPAILRWLTPGIYAFVVVVLIPSTTSSDNTIIKFDILQ